MGMDVTSTVNTMIASANTHDVSNGQVRGINEKEYSQITAYLTEIVKKGGPDAEQAFLQLERLSYMRNCAFNQTDLANSKPSVVASIFNKENSLKRENVISSDTIELDKQGKLEDASEYVVYSQDGY